MILLNYLVFLGAVALVMACVAGLLITEKIIFEPNPRFKIIFKMKKIGLEIKFQL